jgi:glycosyltransferase involved in cell wall biosynthesis
VRIVFLTQYFPPEIGAPQNRLYDLAIRLKSYGVDINILTAMPNYPQMQIYDGYKGKWYMEETIDGLRVQRGWIFVSKGRGVLSRLMNYFSFVFSSFFIGLFKLKKCDYIFCESPPLFLGISAYLICKIKNAKLIFNVSDLWPESAEKLGIIKNEFFLKLAKHLEEFLYAHSALISCQTQGIVKNISLRFPQKKVLWVSNGVDLDNFKRADTIKQCDTLNTVFSENNINKKLTIDDFICLYAGIIGHAQGLEVILKTAHRLKDLTKIKFILMGSGPEKDKLITLSNQLKLDNIFFLQPVTRSRMSQIIAEIDTAIIPLKKLDIFLGAIPSKIFENLAMQKPILLGVEGEAKELFIDRGNCGLAFIPEDDVDLSKKILQLYHNPQLMRTLGKNGEEYVRNNFSRAQIAENFWKELQRMDNAH